jgi:hypothetical protein
MPDITMCVNKKCKKRDTCYRVIAIPSIMQSYADVFEKNHNGECCNFIHIARIQPEFLTKKK